MTVFETADSLPGPSDATAQRNSRSHAALSGERILITGAGGQIGYPMAAYLARDNEVWGLARFRDHTSRERLTEAGVTVHSGDLEDGNLSELPDDFTYVIHLAALMAGDDYDRAIRVNAEGTGLLLRHCRRANAALVMSTQAVYKPSDDPRHVYAETDPLGDGKSTVSPTYSISKIAQESVARFCARAYDLPLVIARMNASYGPNGGVPAQHMDAIAAGQAITTRWDPFLYSPIHQDDINEQAGALLAAATVPATIVNWAGDEVVSVQEWAAYIGELAGRDAEVLVQATPGSPRGFVSNVSRRLSITGPCGVGWHEGIRRTWAARHGGAAGDRAAGASS
jgi:nucleoside-diphosphate-sugar epimerase